MRSPQGAARDSPAQALVGDFRLERLLGRGGMALVYEARQLSVDRPVALKLLAPGAASDDRYRSRFLGEARAMMKIEHPNVVRVYGAGEAGGEVFIAMRLIEGEDLQQTIDRQGPLPPERLLAMVRQIANGLDAAHASGLVHRDVKPKNVMLEALGDEREQCYLVDFGLATEHDASSVTATGEWVGTPAYVSPEQLRGEPVDERSDVYALGVLSFHGLAGTPPYAREHDSGTLLAHLHAPPPSLSGLRGELPGEVDRVIAKALAKAPEDRFGSAGELASELAGALAADRPEAASPPKRRRYPDARLPAQVAPLVGRRKELEILRATLAGGRLLTLLGPGGVGKTTLALRLVAELRARYVGTWLVELDAVQDLAGLELAVARALGLRMASAGSLRSELADLIGSRPSLLLLDNCEHLIPEVAALADELLAACPGLVILATSREPLALEGERIHVLGPLDIPDEEDDALEIVASESAQLFLRRAGEQGVRVELGGGGAAGVARVCARLDGIPLAIELAAARLHTLSVAELDRRLQADLGVLASGDRDRPERQRTLDGLIAWSWRLLEPGEQAILSQLAVFPGSFTLDAAEAVGTASGGSESTSAVVMRLADKSLLQIDATPAQPRFRMLQPVREFCLPRLLSSAEYPAASAAHRAHYLELAERAENLLASSRGPESLDRLDEDHPNLREAIATGLRDDPEEALRIVLAMRQFWACRGLAGEGIELLASILDEAGERLELPSRARAHSAAARLAAGLLGDAQLATPHAMEGLRLARSAGDTDSGAEALLCLSWCESFAGRAEGGLARAEEALEAANAITDSAVLGSLLDAQGLALEQLGDTMDAERAYRRAREVFAGAGYEVGVASVENHLGNLALGAGDAAAAADHFSVARATAESAGDGASVAMAMLNLALIDYLAGRRRSARELFVDSLITNRASGDRVNVAFSVFGLALTEPDAKYAAELHGSATARLEALAMLLSTREEQLRDEELDRLRGTLGSEGMRLALERGRRLPVEDIVLAVTADEPPEDR